MASIQLFVIRWSDVEIAVKLPRAEERKAGLEIDVDSEFVAVFEVELRVSNKVWESSLSRALELWSRAERVAT